MWLRRSPALAILAWLLIACFAQLLLFGIWFEFAERHRDFMIPLLLLAVAVASQSAPRASRDGAGMAGGMIPATQRHKV